MQHILLIEDDELLGEGVVAGLKQDGYRVDWFKEGKPAIKFIQSELFDVILLDLTLPDINGLEILQQLRARGIVTPVLILTARNHVVDRIAGLDSGSDDYVTKPFDLNELLARIRALQRRFSGKRASPLIIYKNIIMNPNDHTVTVSNRPIRLSRREFALLQKLLENVGKVLSRDSLNHFLHGWSDDSDSNTLEVYIHNLRKKLRSNFIRTIYGIGYVVEKEEKCIHVGL
jgi:two-component system, OmpR family, response regulator QseB